MARAIAERLRLDKSNASRRLRVAADGGYVCNLEDKRGKPGRWVIGDPLPEAVDLLPKPAQLATVDNMVVLRGCAVALESAGESDDPDELRCSVCGTRLERPESIARGHCAECHLITNTGASRD